MKLTRITFLLLTSFFLLNEGSAQTEKTKKSLGGNVSLPLRPDYNPEGPLVIGYGMQLYVQDQWYSYMINNPASWSSVFSINSSTTNVVLRYEDEKRVNNKSDWKLVVDYELTTFNTSGTASTTTGSLEITYGLTANYTDIDIKRYTGAVASRIRITDIDFFPTGSGTDVDVIPAWLKEDIYLDVEQETDRHYVLNTATVPAITTTHDYTATVIAGPVTNDELTADSDPSTLPIGNEVALTWEHISGAESYDLEWLFIDIGNSPFTPTAAYDYDFANATRVNLSANSYKISLAYPRGVLIYRARTVTHDVSTPELRIEGDWSLATAGSTSSLSSCSCMLNFDGLNPEINWQSVAVFAEDGKKKEVISYYDGTLRNRQAVTVSNTEKNAIVAENFYDYEGRQALHVLPAPLASTGIHYYNNFNLNASGAPYKKENFDEEGIYPTPGNFLTTSGAAKYYSPGNTVSGINSDYIPDAEGYVYSRTFFTTDGTNRPKSVSGAGKEFRPQGSNDKTTKYFYGKPTSQAELDVMFGNEVGHLSHYFKSATIDPNGQVSYTYTDMDGKTIATCLSGTVPTNLLPVDNKPGSVEVTEDLLDNNNLLSDGNNALTSSTSIMVGETTTYDFAYDLIASEFEVDCNPDPGSEYSSDCLYNLLIYIQDNDGNLLTSTTFTSVVNGGSSAASSVNPIIINGLSHGSVDFSITFQPGNYRLTKVLTVQEYAMLNTTSLPGGEHDLSQCIKVPLVTMEGCSNSCTLTCEQKYKRTNAIGQTEYINELNQVIPETTAVALIAACIAECEDHVSTLVPNPSGLSKCDEKLLQIKADMSPGGQYFDNLADPDAADINNWLTAELDPDVNEGAFFTALSSLLGASIHSWSDVRNNWNAAILDENLNYTGGGGSVPAPFFQYHPEYAAYEFYCVGVADCGNSSIVPSSLVYDDANMQVTANTFTVNPATHSLFNPLHTTPTSTVVPVADPALYCPYTFTVTTQDPLIGWHGGIECDAVCTDCMPGESCNELDAVLKYNLENYLTFNGNDAAQHTYSIWYVMDDPDDIQGNGNTAGTYTVIPDYVVDIFENLHAGGTVNGPVGTDAMSKYTWFRSQYKLFKDFLFYKLFTATTSYTYTPLPGTASFVPDPHYFIPRFPKHPMYETVFSINCDTKITVPDNTIDALAAADPIQTTAMAQCTTDCATAADDWMAKLATCGIVNNPSDPDDIYDLIRENLIAVCVANCSPGTATSGTVTGTPVVYGSSGCALTPPAGGCPPSAGGFATYTPVSGPSETFYSFQEVIDYFTLGTGFESCLSIPVYHPPLNTQDPSLSNDERDGLCDCNKLIYYATHSSDFAQPLNPYDPDNHALMAAAINAQTGGSYDDTDVAAWIAECARYKPLESNLGSFPDFLECSQQSTYDRADCSCERFTGFFNTLGIIATAGSSSYTSGEKAGMVYLINNMIKPTDPITVPDLEAWLNECQNGATPGMINLLSVEMPDLFLCPALPGSPTSENMANTLLLANCQTQALLSSAATAAITYYSNIGQLNNYMAEAYNSTCLNNISESAATSPLETFTATFERNTFLYTLYYYDQAGDLIKTVPPQGVHLLPSSDLDEVRDYRNGADPVPMYPPHTFVTHYKYDFQDKLTYQNTPDAGTSTFCYDRKHQLLFSQNAKQQPGNQYSYTLYDPLGRITEVGEAADPGSVVIDNDVTCQMTAPDITSYNAVYAALPSVKSQVTSTFYDEQAEAFNYNSTTVTLNNLRNRVAQTTLDRDGNGSYESATHYSYDIHGNVNVLYQENKDLPLEILGHSVKKVSYGYDLISGKVNEVHYQPGYLDQYHYKYEYDADNRITRTLTSADGYSYFEDAKYFYYPHGPLARTELGDKQVQGQDFAYTLQGWLKGTNSNTLKLNRDMSRDGLSLYGQGNIGALSALTGNASFRNRNFGADAYGYSLHYYNDDYKAVSVPTYTAPTESDVADFFLAGTTTDTEAEDVRDHPGLYNGNISRMVTSLLNNSEGMEDVHNNLYQYDQLNRIKQKDVYSGTQTGTSNLWDEGTIGLNKWQEKFEYDFNGNFSYADRRGHLAGGNITMDDLTYYYYDDAGSTFIAGATPGGVAKPTNKLSYVADGVTDDNRYTTDIDRQYIDNYSYDAIGNLTADTKEEIASIAWNVYGKIATITRSSGSTKDDLEFLYDPAGNRVAKIVKKRTALGGLQPQDRWTYTYYVRDAQGNILSNYELSFENAGANLYRHFFAQTDIPVYGSSRLGVYNAERSLFPPNTYTTISTALSGGLFTYAGSGYPSQQTPLTLSSPFSNSRTLGMKQYEQSNHLGNVLTTVSDRKLIKASNIFKGTEEFEYTPLSNAVTGNNGTRGDLLYNSNPNPGSFSPSTFGYPMRKEIAAGDVITATVESRRLNNSTLNPAQLIIEIGDNAGHSIWIAGWYLPTSTSWSASAPLTYTFNPAHIPSYSPGPYYTNVFVWSGGYTSIPVNSSTPPTFVDNLTVEIDHASLTEFDYFSADVLSCTDYYAFGAPMPGRSYNSNDYRYGFNGKENDNETVSTGEGTQDYGLRIYNPALGRFLSVDPMTGDFPWYTPYQFAGNKPIANIDLDGAEEKNATMPAQDNGKGGTTTARDNTTAGYQPESLLAKLQSASQPNVLDECEGGNCQTVKGAADGYNVSIPSSATNLVQSTQSFPIAGNPNHTTNVTSAFSIGDNTFSWNSDYNAYYSSSSNEIYGGSGMAIANGYMSSVKLGGIIPVGALWNSGGSQNHPSFGTGTNIYAGQEFAVSLLPIGSGAQLLGRGTGILGSISKSSLGFGRLGGLSGAAGKINYYTKLAMDAGYSSVMSGARTKAGFFVQLNHNANRMILGLSPKTLYSNSAATIMGRAWQNQAMGGGLLNIGFGIGVNANNQINYGKK